MTVHLPVMVKRVILSARPITDFHADLSSPPQTLDKWVTCMLSFQCELETKRPGLLTV